MTYQPTKEDTELLNKLKLIEDRVWQKYFPEEQIKFRSTFEETNKLFYKNLHTVKQDMFLVDQNGNTLVKNEAFKKHIDKFYQNIPGKIKNKVERQTNEWQEFLPKLLNVYTHEVVNDENLKLHQKIIALLGIKDGIEKIALFANINLFTPYVVALAYLDREIKTHSEKYTREFTSVLSAIENLSKENLYYWPGTVEQLDKFNSLLLKYKLVEGNANYRLSFQEKYSPESQIIWSAENKQLIYLLFLLYGNKRIYNGIGIHQIAVLVFKKIDDQLEARNLNTQLGKFMDHTKTSILRGALDDKLLEMEKLIKEYNS